MKLFTIIASLGCILLNGCAYYNNSPSGAGGTDSFNATTGVATLVGVGGGALAGHALNKHWGAPVGAAVGGLVVGGATALYEAKTQRERIEAYEEGKRQGRAKVFDAWWKDTAEMSDPAPQPGGTSGPKTRIIPPSDDVSSSKTYDYEAAPNTP